MRYMYQTLQTPQPTASDHQLNDFGKEGWELLTVYEYGGMWVYIFARERTDADDKAEAEAGAKEDTAPTEKKVYAH